jgi:protoheme IX farnesyltransferase
MKVIAAEARTMSLPEYAKLTKPRITALVVATTLIGFYLASSGPMNFWLLLNALIGTALVASGASALNMVLEWDADSRMRRTEQRPIPSGRLTILQSFSWGSALVVSGVFYLWISVNLLTSLLAIITVNLYLFAYTPLKRRSYLCTAVGAIPGAIPPMMGWTAARNSLDPQAWWLFAILFFWQLPHFLSIAWLYRDDYARGGFPMLPVLDADGSRTSRHIITETVALVLVTMLPAISGNLGHLYLTGAILCGCIFLYMGIRLAISRSSMDARRLLLTSVIYLPVLLALMMIDKK